MSMWNWISYRHFEEFHHRSEQHELGKKAAQLHAEGYTADSDAVLDDMAERQRAWEQVERPKPIRPSPMQGETGR